MWTGCSQFNVLINFGQFVVQAVLTRPIAILYMQVAGHKKGTSARVTGLAWAIHANPQVNRTRGRQQHVRIQKRVDLI